MRVYRRPEIIVAHSVGDNTAGWAQRSSPFTRPSLDEQAVRFDQHWLNVGISHTSC